jgi:O-antigen ligase
MWARLMSIGYLPLGLFAVLLTASRGGFLAALAALVGCAILLGWGHKGAALAVAMALPAAAAGLWLAIPHQIFERLATIPEQLHGGDLNQRLNIWSSGWHAFRQAPVAGTGAGTFVAAAGLAPLDTAHNTALSIAVGGGLCALTLAAAIVVVAVIAALRTSGLLRVALVTSLGVWMITSLTATVEESRTTWLLLALIAVAGRLTADDPQGLESYFPAPTGESCLAPAAGQIAQTQS